jgi:hypothetical protein
VSWVRFDDKFYDHPKVSALAPSLMDRCVGLHLLASCWCSNQLTDGYITEHQPARLLGHPAAKQISELVRVGMWEPAEGGYQIHDYLDYNPSRDAVLAERESAKVRMNKARSFKGSSGEVRENIGRSSDNPVPVPDVLAEHKQKGMISEAESTALSSLCEVPNYPFNITRDLELLREAKISRPDTEVEKWRDYWEPKWAKKKSAPNYRLSLRNWFSRVKPSPEDEYQANTSNCQYPDIVVPEGWQA